MNAILLVTTLLCLTLKSVLGKVYTDRTDGGVFTYTVLSGLGTVAFFLVTSKNLNFQTEIIPYAVWFGVSYLLAGIFGLKAIAVGSLSLTSLVTNCSLIMPTLYGLVFLHEPGNFFLYFGILLLLAALILVNKTSVTVPITGKWILFVMISFIGNGMCSISQKAQQDAFGGTGKNELMIMALTIVIVVNAVLMLIHERKNVKRFVRLGFVTGFVGGAANGVVNLFVMIMVGRMPASVVFPLISAGSIVLMYLISRFVYKEELSPRQKLGFLLGILSVVLLNL